MIGKVHYGKSVLLGVFLVLASGIFSALQSQDPNITEAGAAAAGEGLKIQNYDPIAITDPRFTVNNMNLSRRYASNGEGEILDISFDITNLTSDPIEMSAYVTAFWETDAIDRPLRAYIPYPQWRIHDPDKETHLVHYITVTPNDIPDEEIWTDKDPDYMKQKVIWDRMKNSVAGNRPIPPFRPPFWKFLTYMNNNPNKGLNFTLYGRTGPTLDKVVQSNYIPPTPEEKKLKMHKTLAEHKYTLLHNRRKCEFRSHHFSRYRADFNFFNMISIVLFDRGKVQLAAEQEGRELAPNEERANPLVYKVTYRINPKNIKY